MSAKRSEARAWNWTTAMNRWRLVGYSAFLACGALVACSPTAEDYRAIDDWLTAEEIDTLQEARVVALGSSLLRGRATTDHLVAALGGPGDTALANLRLRFAHSYRRMSRPLTPEREYVEGFVENAEALYQVRAAHVLGEIGGTRAADGLVAALQADSIGEDTLRSDVRDAVTRALVTARTTPFAGQVSDTVGATLDTISISAAPGSSQTFDGDEQVRLEGGPFPNDVMVSATGGGLQFVLAAPVGSYAVVVENAPPGGSQRIPILVDRVDYTPSPPAPRPELWDGSRRVRRYSVLTGSVDPSTGLRAAGRPVDHFEVNPDHPVRASADVQWRGPGWIDAMWLECPEPVPAGDFHAVILDEGSVPVSSTFITVQGAAGTPIDLVNQANGRFRVSAADLPPPPLDLVIQRTGFLPRALRYTRPPVHEVPIWLNDPLPPRVAADAGSSDPYRVYSDTTSTLISPPDCYVLQILKLDRDSEYLVVRVAITFSNP